MEAEPAEESPMAFHAPPQAHGTTDSHIPGDGGIRSPPSRKTARHMMEANPSEAWPRITERLVREGPAICDGDDCGNLIDDVAESLLCKLAPELPIA
jgi:hypothetical protein